MTARDELHRYFAAQIAARCATLAGRGRWDEAEADLERWGRLAPHDPEVVAMHARILYHQGRRQEALDAIEASKSRHLWSDELAMLRSSLLEDDWIRRDHDARRESNQARRREWWAELLVTTLDGASRWLHRGWSFLALAGLAAVCLAIASLAGR